MHYVHNEVISVLILAPMPVEGEGVCPYRISERLLD
jgi:hypothetical protein